MLSVIENKAIRNVHKLANPKKPTLKARDDAIWYISVNPWGKIDTLYVH